MDFFEFILIITSVVYALCMAPLLTGIVRVLQFDGEKKHFLPQAVFAVFLFLLVPMLWWTMWIFRDIDWHFATYFYMIIEPAVMFIACSLIFPQRFDHHELNLEHHYYKIRASFLISCIVLGILVFADGVVLGTEPVWYELRYIQIFFLAILIWGLADRRRLAQYAAALGSLIAAVILLYMGFWVPAGPASLEVFGLSIPDKYMSIGVPAILLVLSLHLLVHVRHLGKWITDSAKIPEFPWTPLMRNRLAQLLSIATHILLPLGALFWICMASAIGQHWATCLIATASSALSMVFIVWSFRALTSYRRNRPS